MKLEYRDNNKSQWLRAPQYLTSFASAMQTCQYFHNVIKFEVKFDGKSTSAILEDLQLRCIYEALNHIRNGERSREVLALQEVYSIAGCFWRNAIFGETKSMELLGKFVLNYLTLSARSALVPDLESLVVKHTVPSRLSGRPVTLTIDDNEFEQNIGEIILENGKSAVLGYDFVITTIAGVLTVEHVVRAGRLLEDIRNSSSEEWYLFHSSPGYYEYDDVIHPTEWVLVNYKQRKMYDCPDAGLRYYFWKDAWDISKII